MSALTERLRRVTATTDAYRTAAQAADALEAAEAKLAAVEALLVCAGDPEPPGAVKDAWAYSCGWHDALYTIHRTLHPEEKQ